jgi:mercuric ion transport protein
MRVEVLYFEGCPNHAPTVERLRAELMSHGVTEEIEEVEIHNQSQAEALGFLGSPSVRINGLDIEGEARDLKSFGMSCRTYLEGAVRSGLPSNELIRRALDEQTSQAGRGGAAFKSDDPCCQGDSAASTQAKLSSPVASLTKSSRSGSIALFSGGLAAILASTCCLGPLVLVTLGISGAWIGNLTRLEPYRPFFIVVALVALFFAWRSIYRPVEACKPGEVCALPRTRRLYKFLFWTSAVLTLLALTYPYFAKYFY